MSIPTQALAVDSQALVEAFADLLAAQQKFEALGGHEALGLAPKEPKSIPASSLLYGKPVAPKLSGEKEAAKEASKKKIESRMIQGSNATLLKHFSDCTKDGWRVISVVEDSSNALINVFLEREV